MAYFAHKVVPGDWDISQPLPFTESQYLRARDSVEPGTHIIVYQGSPVDGVVAQAQANQTFLKVEEWQDTLAVVAREKGYPYLLPVKVQIKHAGPGILPLARVREILGDPDFPRPDEDWRILTDGEYGELRTSRI